MSCDMLCDITLKKVAMDVHLRRSMVIERPRENASNSLIVFTFVARRLTRWITSL
jgi:hypothetical protein